VLDLQHDKFSQLFNSLFCFISQHFVNNHSTLNQKPLFSQNSLSYCILCNEFKHNILTLEVKSKTGLWGELLCKQLTMGQQRLKSQKTWCGKRSTTKQYGIIVSSSSHGRSSVRHSHETPFRRALSISTPPPTWPRTRRPRSSRSSSGRIWLPSSSSLDNASQNHLTNAGHT